MFQLLSNDSKTKARLGRLTTDHGIIETPIFMPVGTLATVKAVEQQQLVDQVKAQIILGNTYHLYLRPGNSIMREAGGLHQFMKWDRPILTDSGGYQVFSLSGNRKLEERGVTFKSHLDGSKHQFTPESVVETERILGSDIMMVLDECPPYPSTYEYALNSMKLTHRWAARCKKAFDESEPLYGHRQFLFGIAQGSTYKDLRQASAEAIAELDFDGNAIGGLSVGEPNELMYEMTDHITDFLPAEKARYLMGVGTPADLIHGVARGVDMFDCVMPTRNARNGTVFTRNGIVNLRNAKWKTHHEVLDESFPTDFSSKYTMAYLHHLVRCNEILGMTLASLQNLTFYLWLMAEIREQLAAGTFHSWYKPMIERVTTRL
ncbi:MAG: tRNA guanosine(34) transglycosylase Tgt [Balneolales bacterium]|nr:tRNA guanosine(34) transglycosylase Tgt [Balneolales bacterium]